MAVEMEGLEFQIEATSDEAIKGISALSSTFSKKIPDVKVTIVVSNMNTIVLYPEHK